jgi:hypothetical protein
MPDGDVSTRTASIDLAITADDDLRVLRGALLAARATETAELRRRGYRLSTGYGTDSAREGMSAEVDRLRRRVELLDRLIAALPGEAANES